MIIITGLFALMGAEKLKMDSRYLPNQRKGLSSLISRERILVFLMLAFLWFLTAFRGENVGSDTSEYLGWFVRIGEGTFHDIFKGYYMENGFLMYLYLIARIFGIHPQIMLIITASICFLLMGHYIFASSKNFYLSLCLLFCLLFSVFTNEIRQGMAVVISVYGYLSYKEKRYIKSFFLILFAGMFHASALAVFLLYLHKFFPKDLKKIYIINGVLCVLSFKMVFNNLLLYLFPRFTIYFESERAGNGRLALIIEIFMSSVLLFFAHKAYRKKKHSLELAVFEMYSLFFIFALNMSLINRITYYFSALLIVEIPNMIQQSQIKNKFGVGIAISSMFLIWFTIVLVFRQSWNRLIPYEFYYNNIQYQC